jgi:hypothetical protein
MTDNKPTQEPLSAVLARATSSLEADAKATAETVDQAVERLRRTAQGAPNPAAPPAGAAGAPTPTPTPTPVSEEDAIQLSSKILPYLFSLQENFIVALAQRTRGSNALGYAEFCLRNKMAEAMTEYVLQVHVEGEIDAAALVRSLTVQKQAALGHGGAK